MARKYYIPITRSGSSILASLLTQHIERSRKPPRPLKGAEGFIVAMSFVISAIVMFSKDMPLEIAFPAIFAVIFVNIVMIIRIKHEP